MPSLLCLQQPPCLVNPPFILVFLDLLDILGNRYCVFLISSLDPTSVASVPLVVPMLIDSNVLNKCIDSSMS